MRLSPLWPLLSLLTAAAAATPPPPSVATTHGHVEGVWRVAANGKTVAMYWGIPFATPPLGNLRFRPPQPLRPWQGVLKAKDRPASCMQVLDTTFPGFRGTEMWNSPTALSEDCLYLNLAVPHPLSSNVTAIMVWVYGGSFYSGTSTLDVYDPAVLASEQSIIVASINYRVASLGFLFTGQDGEAEGNQGLLDQRMAFKWIRDNARQFGGSEENITLFSESAGSASVAFHLISPGSSPFFSQAILQSSAATNPWALVTTEEAALRARRLAEILKCPHTQSEGESMLRCLREVNGSVLVSAEFNGIVFGIMGCPFVPVFHTNFFTVGNTPKQALTKKTFKRTNLLMGINSNEANFFLLFFLPDLFPLAQEPDMELDDFKKSIVELNSEAANFPRAKAAIEYEYMPWGGSNDSSRLINAIDAMVGDYQFVCSVMEMALRYSQVNEDVYVYNFKHRSSQHYFLNWTGVMHGDEIAFVFGEPFNTTHFNYTEKEKSFSKDIMTFWANFAKTGNPNRFENGSWTNVFWPIHSSRHRELLVLDVDDMHITNGYRARQCAFWDTYLPSIIMHKKKEKELEACERSECVAFCASNTNEDNLDNTKLEKEVKMSSSMSSSVSISSYLSLMHIVVVLTLLVLVFGLS